MASEPIGHGCSSSIAIAMPEPKTLLPPRRDRLSANACSRKSLRPAGVTLKKRRPEILLQPKRLLQPKGRARHAPRGLLRLRRARAPSAVARLCDDRLCDDRLCD